MQEPVEAQCARCNLVDIKEAETAFRELISAMERDRELAVQRSPVHRRDFDNALGAAHTALKNLAQGKVVVARNLWTRNTALRSIARTYDAHSARIETILE